MTVHIYPRRVKKIQCADHGKHSDEHSKRLVNIAKIKIKHNHRSLGDDNIIVGGQMSNLIFKESPVYFPFYCQLASSKNRIWITTGQAHSLPSQLEASMRRKGGHTSESTGSGVIL